MEVCNTKKIVELLFIKIRNYLYIIITIIYNIYIFFENK